MMWKKGKEQLWTGDNWKSTILERRNQKDDNSEKEGSEHDDSEKENLKKGNFENTHIWINIKKQGIWKGQLWAGKTETK